VSLQLIAEITQWTLLILVTYVLITGKANLRPVNSKLPKQDTGIPYGVQFPRTNLKTIFGDTVNINGSDVKPTIVFFTASNCPACKSLYPIIEIVRKKYESQANFVSIIVSNEKSLRDYVLINNINIPVTHLDLNYIEEFNTKIFPFAYYLSPSGHVLAKGVVSEEEHFNLLFGQGKASMQAQKIRELNRSVSEY